MDFSAQGQQILNTLLNDLPLPITITQQVDGTGSTYCLWQWYKYNGSKSLFKDVHALNDALTQTMNTVIQYAPPSK